MLQVAFTYFCRQIRQNWSSNHIGNEIPRFWELITRPPLPRDAENRNDGLKIGYLAKVALPLSTEILSFQIRSTKKCYFFFLFDPLRALFRSWDWVGHPHGQFTTVFVWHSSNDGVCVRNSIMIYQIGKGGGEETICRVQTHACHLLPHHIHCNIQIIYIS